MPSPFAARAHAGAGPPARAQRLFIALWPDDATRERIGAQARALRIDGRLVPVANLHVTLVFVGSVAAARVPALEAVVDGARGAGFDLTLDRLGHFSAARVAWAGCRAVPTALTALQAGLDAAVRRAGFATEARAFRPHLTLARDCRQAPAGEWTPVAWPVREAVLVVSEPGDRGPVYRVLRRRLLAD